MQEFEIRLERVFQADGNRATPAAPGETGKSA